MYQTDRRKQVIRLDGKVFTPDEIAFEWKRVEELASQTERTTPHCAQIHCRLELFRFLMDWFNDSEEMTVHTSGSTGEAKPIRVRKSQMMESACATCDILGLKPRQTALLCLSLSFIAGKMMVVRALVADLDMYFVLPNGYPMQYADKNYNFAAMVPMQIFNSLQLAEEKERLRRIGTLLIGGGPISKKLENILQDFTNPIFVTYGMAETLSHVALRRINGPEASEYYKPLPNVKISLNEEGCLIIDAPMVNEYLLITNDRAEILPDGRFRILGRQDNVINTGGIKVQAEALEAFLSDFIDVPFAITSQSDEKFGEIVVLVVEGSINEPLLTQTLHAENLAAPEFPKRIVSIESLPRTDSGKINRAVLRQKIQMM
jgi:o-succinylbenzoate---CoA ligase